MLVALGTLASQQAKGTEATMDALVHLLNYAATHPEAKIRYHASDMVLHIVSDASYLSASEARSRLGGYFFLSKNMGPDIPSADAAAPPFNAPIHVNSSIIKAVLSSAAEAELGALFFNAKDGCSLRTTLIDMGYPQPATPIQVDNACAVGIANDTVRQKRSKAIDMRFYWVRDRVKEKQFVVYWQKGSDNDADYFTKHHPPSHHRVKRSRYLHEDGKPVPDPAPKSTAGRTPLEGSTLVGRATGPFPDTAIFQSPLHLGTGTGLVALAASMAGAKSVLATDYENIPLTILKHAMKVNYLKRGSSAGLGFEQMTDTLPNIKTGM